MVWSPGHGAFVPEGVIFNCIPFTLTSSTCPTTLPQNFKKFALLLQNLFGSFTGTFYIAESQLKTSKKQ